MEPWLQIQTNVRNVLFVSTSMENHGTMRTELGNEMEVGLVQVGNLGPLVLARRGKSAAGKCRQRTSKVGQQAFHR